MAIKTLMAAILALLCTLPAFASDLTIPQSTLYPYRSTLQFNDDFLFGQFLTPPMLTNGGINTGTAPIASHPGILNINTTAVINTVASAFLSSGASAFIPSDVHNITWLARPNSNDANTVYRFGAMESPAVSPPNDGIYVEKAAADTNWFCVTRSGGVQTRVNSGISVGTTAFLSFFYFRNSSGVQFSIGGANVCSLMTTNIPTGALRPTLMIVNTAAAAKNIDIDYFEMNIFNMAR